MYSTDRASQERHSAVIRKNYDPDKMSPEILSALAQEFFRAFRRLEAAFGEDIIETREFDGKSLMFTKTRVFVVHDFPESTSVDVIPKSTLTGQVSISPTPWAIFDRDEIIIIKTTTTTGYELELKVSWMKGDSPVGDLLRLLSAE